jgi:Ring finger domain
VQDEDVIKTKYDQNEQTMVHCDENHCRDGNDFDVEKAATEDIIDNPRVASNDHLKQIVLGDTVVMETVSSDNNTVVPNDHIITDEEKLDGEAGDKESVSQNDKAVCTTTVIPDRGLLDPMTEYENGFLRLRGKINNVVSTDLNKNDADEENQKISNIDELSASQRATRSVSNCCAICLDSYKPNDVVVWSPSSSDCQHAFHEECILDWMCTNQKGTPCPMCRQDILPNLHQYYDGKYIKRHNLVAPESTFSLSAIRLR